MYKCNVCNEILLLSKILETILVSLKACLGNVNCYIKALYKKYNIDYTYSSVLNISQVATTRNFDPNYGLPNVAQVSLPKTFQIVATWLQFSTEE